MLLTALLFSPPFLLISSRMGVGYLPGYGAWRSSPPSRSLGLKARWSQDVGKSELPMKKISSFMAELLPCDARWEYEGILTVDTIARASTACLLAECELASD
jgi:hypothetical protein